mmetsp:Transcript_19613/g.31788  ORF Transcript_19613/g.31788 Transcript_19613/m.31788 type:complete len:178 (+) Transcript_19613:67-600(+)|eukprot:CAMPEP_0169115282 /NCGR_PEP_ID=MMETSP1015-20121227/29252_1 /TAXON_ID=342587 /ORGANISM="Karlodinium micrum, Strain CCMP2283" /LENGTH=177 /DNA_ID=CAMNT_0009177709 /DNA_START=66 /DNA_END=599 /DNA_ORIENTATION=-
MISFPPTTFEVSRELFYSICALAMQDLAQVVLALEVIVFVGWCVISMPVRDNSSVPPHKLEAKLAAEDNSANSQDDSMEEADVHARSADAMPSASFSLLEHYGIFGVTPGTWINNNSDLSYCDPESDDESHIVDEDPVRECANLGFVLLEHYNVLEASPKCWRRNSFHTLGEILSIT